jgi:hypothetical protein
VWEHGLPGPSETLIAGRFGAALLNFALRRLRPLTRTRLERFLLVLPVVLATHPYLAFVSLPARVGSVRASAGPVGFRERVAAIKREQELSISPDLGTKQVQRNERNVRILQLVDFKKDNLGARGGN